jgi:hypothetical protein
MGYYLVNTLRDGTSQEITPVASNISWGGDIKQAARRLEVDLAFGDDPNLPRVNVPLGSLLILRNDSEELIRGVVFEVQKDTSGMFKVVCYDHLIYLLKSQGTYIFRNMTPEAITQKLCSDFNIPPGTIAASGVTLNKLILRDMSIYDMIIAAWTEASKRNGKKYMPKMKEGKLTVIEKGAQASRWIIAEGENLSSASSSESINDMKNKVIIMGDKDQVLAEISSENLISQYGTLQELRNEGNITAGEAQSIARSLLEDLAKISQDTTISCIGIDEVEAGSAIEVTESLTGLSGAYYVGNDEHSVQGDQHMMTLKISLTDDVETLNAPEVEE